MTDTPSGRALLRPGSRLGHYEIVGLLGAGGMGEVYRARDPRLGRDVAIKVIAFDVEADPDRQRRFEQEARTVASINHPNILSVYDVGSEAGSPYLVFELLEGESLGQQMRRERLPVRKALEIAVQIARGLAAAHQRGVVHRDVKPDNVFVTKDGGAKLLDFGLAKLVLGEVTGAATEYSTISGTHPGMLLGTPGYMSPEQIRGQASDARSDIFSFGVVLCELLTAQRPFRKDTPAETMAAILNEDPPLLTSLDATVPPALDRIVRRCLEKKPEDRFHSAHDLALALEAVSGGSNVTGPVASPRIFVQPTTSRFIFFALAALALGAAGWALRGLGPNRDPWIGQPVTRFELPLPEGAQFGDSYPSMAISPDGTTLAIVAKRGGVQELYARALSGSHWTRLPATEGATNPFFSPKGDWLAFFSPGKLKRVSVAGGTPQVICDVKSVRAGLPSGNWSDDGQVLFSSWPDRGLWRVPAAGGVPERLRGTEAPGGPQVWYRRPQVLPGGRDLLFGAWSAGNSRLETLSLENAKRRTLIAQGGDPSYAPTNHIVFGWDNQLLAASFDPQELEVQGVPIPLVEDVRMNFGAGAPSVDYTLSRSGTLVYVPGRKAERRVVWSSRAGQLDPLHLPPRAYLFPTLSPDQDRVAVTLAEGGSRDVWIGDLSRGTLSRLTMDGDAMFSLWTPDAKRVLYTSSKSGQYNLFWKSADGSGPAEPLTQSEHAQRPTSVSADGRFVLFNDLDPASLMDVWVLGLDGDRRPVPLLRTAANERFGVFSPDGRWVSYDSDESGRFEVYLRPYPGPGEREQISIEGGTHASWNPNGRELFYTAGEQMMSASFEAGPRVRIGKPRPLFRIGPPAEPLQAHPHYSVAADGERFLFAEHGESTSAEGRLHVVANWFGELQRRVPAR